MSPYPNLLTSEMFERFGKFVQSPRRDSYLAVRSALISSDGYDPYSDDLYDAEGLVDQMAFAAARDKLLESMPNLLLSPRAHHLLAIAAEETGDNQSSLMEGLIASACAKGIVATGAGSKADPYLVVRTEDEYDVIQYLEKKLVTQILIEDANESFDLMDCEGGSQLWFDISDMRNQQGKRLKHVLAQADQRLVREECTALVKLGINARVVEQGPLSPEPMEIEEDSDVQYCIEIAEGPIRWVSRPEELGRQHEFHVPDAKIGRDAPRVFMRAEYKSVRSFPLFGRRKISGVHWDMCELHAFTDEKISLGIAEYLNSYMDLKETIISVDFGDFHIGSNPRPRELGSFRR